MHDLPKPLTDELKAQQLDRHTIAWWDARFVEVQTGYRGATHGINRCWAAHEDVMKVVRELEARLTSEAAARAETEAVVGKLKEDVVRLNASLDKCREAYRQLTKGE